MSCARKIIYEERYKGLKILGTHLPTLPSVPGYEVIDAEVLAAGKYDDGTEFQNLRVVLREKEQ